MEIENEKFLVKVTAEPPIAVIGMQNALELAQKELLKWQLLGETEPERNLCPGGTVMAFVQKQISGPVYQMSLDDFEETEIADWKIAVMKEEYRCVSTQSARWSQTASVPTARNAPMPTAPRGKSDMARTMVLDNRTTR